MSEVLGSLEVVEDPSVGGADSLGGALLLSLRFSESLVFRACGQKVRVLQAARWHPVRLLTADTANAVHSARSKSRFTRGSSG
jgi:hypothetical protein